MANSPSVKVVLNHTAIGMLTSLPATKLVLRQCAENALDFQQSIVPVDTGNLKSSLGIRENSNGTVDIGTVKKEVLYALPVEEGHRTKSGTWVPAQPFIRPAIDAAKRGLK